MFVFITDNELTHHHHGGLDYKEYVNFARGRISCFMTRNIAAPSISIPKVGGTRSTLTRLILRLRPG